MSSPHDNNRWQFPTVIERRKGKPIVFVERRRK
jgi:hypothetical protein